MTTPFTHRALLGWISEFIDRPLPGVWPQIPLDDATLADLEGYYDLCRDVGYNEVILWGLFVDRRWPVDIASTVDDDRRKRIQRTIDAAHRRGLKVLSGLGLYSWGFEAIIEAFPALSRTNPRAMCPSVPQSREWMEKVIAFILDNFAVDGLNMQSADQGRCTCPECARLSNMAYHARLNIEAAEYIRRRWPGKLLIMDNWGCPFSDPAGLPSLIEMSKAVDFIIDSDNSAENAGQEYRRELIASLHCPFGTLAGRSVWPPQRWPLDRWFVPTTRVNADYLSDLFKDGGRAVEQFVVSRVNPSGEITLRFTGKLLADPGRNTDDLLREAVSETYLPQDDSARDAVLSVVDEAEAAFFAATGPYPVGLMYIDGGLFHDTEPNPPCYLEKMTPQSRAAYAAAIRRLQEAFTRVAPRLQAKEKADLTLRCFDSIIADVRRVEGGAA